MFRKGCLLNKKVFDKLKEFSLKNEIPQAILISKIIKDKSISIKPRTYGQVVLDSKSQDHKNDIFRAILFDFFLQFFVQINHRLLGI